MKIQKKKNNILYTTESAKVLIVYNVEKVEKEGIDIFINKSGNSLNIEKGLLIDSCGEYEDNDVMIQVFPSPENNIMDLISIDNEGINVVIVDSKTQIPQKKILEQTGINNILVFNDNGGVGKVFELIENFSPEFFIPITEDAVLLEQICKKLTVLPGEKVKNFVLTQEDLPDDEEEQPLSLILFE
jgi:hypothetical protein